jgi:hypothetical protein
LVSKARRRRLRCHESQLEEVSETGGAAVKVAGSSIGEIPTATLSSCKVFETEEAILSDRSQ